MINERVKETTVTAGTGQLVKVSLVDGDYPGFPGARILKTWRHEANARFGPRLNHSAFQVVRWAANANETLEEGAIERLNP